MTKLNLDFERRVQITALAIFNAAGKCGCPWGDTECFVQEKIIEWMRIALAALDEAERPKS